MVKIIFSLLFLLSSVVISAQTDINTIEKGKLLVNTNACTACHKEYGPNLAPGFSGIGIIHKKAEGDKANIRISEAIAKGSQGQYPHFKKTAMPPYAHLSEDDRLAIAEYILSISKNNKI